MEAAQGRLKSALGWLWGIEGAFGWRKVVFPSAVTWAVLVVTVVVGTLDVLLPARDGVGPLTWLLGTATARLASGQWWRSASWVLVNSPVAEDRGFLFSATGHLLENMIGLVLVGPRLERIVGHLRFLILYVIATVAASAAAMVVFPVSWNVGGGSSASIYALLGAILVAAFLARRTSRQARQYFTVALVGILIVPGLLVSSLAVSLGSRGINISHGVGFVVGVALAFAWLRYDKRVGIALIVPVLVVVSAALVVFRSAQSRESDPRVALIPIETRTDLVAHAFGSIWTHGDGVLTRLDSASGRIVARIKVASDRQATLSGGGGMVAAGESLWVSGDRSVVEVDPSTNAVKSSVALPGVGPWGLSASDDVLWAALNTEDKVARIDLRTRRVRVVRVGDEPYTVLANERGVWVANYNGRSVVRLDPRTGHVIATTRLDAEPYWMEFDRSLWVGTTNALIGLDPESLRVLDRFDLPDYFYAFTLDDQGGAWVSNRFDFSIRRVDLRSGRILDRLRVGLGQPAGMTSARDLWVADPERRSVLRVQAGLRP